MKGINAWNILYFSKEKGEACLRRQGLIQLSVKFHCTWTDLILSHVDFYRNSRKENNKRCQQHIQDHVEHRPEGHVVIFKGIRISNRVCGYLQPFYSIKILIKNFTREPATKKEVNPSIFIW